MGEVSLGLLSQLLMQKRSVDAVLDDKDELVAKGVTRVSEARRTNDENAKTETELWESLIVQLSRSVPDEEEEETNNTVEEAPVLAIEGRPNADPGHDLAQ